jgi:hypothetical protein
MCCQPRLLRCSIPPLTLFFTWVGGNRFYFIFIIIIIIIFLCVDTSLSHLLFKVVSDSYRLGDVNFLKSCSVECLVMIYNLIFSVNEERLSSSLGLQINA